MCELNPGSGLLNCLVIALRIALFPMLRPGDSCAAWRRAFIHFSQQHPEVRVLDAFDAIKILQCRETMLQPFDEGPIIVQVLPVRYISRSKRSCTCMLCICTAGVLHCIPTFAASLCKLEGQCGAASGLLINLDVKQ